MPTANPPYIAQALIASPLGDVRLACTATGLAGAWFTEDTKDAPGAWPDVPHDAASPVGLRINGEFVRHADTRQSALFDDDRTPA
jgi:hypothetical protein